MKVSVRIPLTKLNCVSRQGIKVSVTRVQREGGRERERGDVVLEVERMSKLVCSVVWWRCV